LELNNILTWWETGADGMSIHVDGDDKVTMTVLATIWANRKTWPLWFVVKGQTTRVEHSQIGAIGSNWRTHSESGWMRGELFAEFLHHLRDQGPNREPIIDLMCGIHGSHRTPGVTTAAADLNIRLMYIASGATDRVHPRHRCIV
jgi:hypothetical protein